MVVVVVGADGTGSVGAAIVQYLVGWLIKTTGHCITKADGDQHCSNWDAIFYMLVIGDGLAALCLAGLVFKDVGSMIRRFRRRHHHHHKKLQSAGGSKPDEVEA